MKWIKKFEELSPELIRRAGKGLIEKGHKQKGLRIFDFLLNIYYTFS